MKNFGILLIIFLIANLILPFSVLSQEVVGVNLDNLKGTISAILAIEEDWLKLPTVIYNLILPFIAIFAVTLGLLKELRIYRNQPNIEIVLAFVIAFSTLPLGAFAIFVNWTLTFLGIFAYGIFLLLFVIGGGFFAYNRSRGWQASGVESKAVLKSFRALEDQTTRIKEQRIQINNKIKEFDDKLVSEGNPMKIDHWENEIKKLRVKLVELRTDEDSILDRMRALKRSHEMS